MMFRIVIFLSLLFILPAISYSEESKQSNPSNPGPIGIELEGRYWMPALSGLINKGDGLVGTDINLIDDLGIKEDQRFFMGKAALKFFGRNKLRLSYLPISIDGSKVITRSFNFKGREYTINTLVNSSVDASIFKIGYGLDLISNPLASLGVFIDLNYADVSASINAPDLGFLESGSVTGYLPAIGIGGRVYLIPRKLSLSAEVEGLLVSNIGRYIEAEGSIDYVTFTNLGLSLGYKTIDLRAEKDNDKGELTLSGLYLSVFLRF